MRVCNNVYMEEKERGQRIQKFDKARIAALSDSLRTISGEIEGFAKKLQDEEFAGVLEIDGGKKAYEALRSLNRWYGDLVIERRAADLPTLDEPQTNGLPSPSPAKPKGKK